MGCEKVSVSGDLCRMGTDERPGQVGGGLVVGWGSRLKKNGKRAVQGRQKRPRLVLPRVRLMTVETGPHPLPGPNFGRGNWHTVGPVKQGGNSANPRARFPLKKGARPCPGVARPGPDDLNSNPRNVGAPPQEPNAQAAAAAPFLGACPIRRTRPANVAE